MNDACSLCTIILFCSSHDALFAQRCDTCQKKTISWFEKLGLGNAPVDEVFIPESCPRGHTVHRIPCKECLDAMGLGKDERYEIGRVVVDRVMLGVALSSAADRAGSRG